MIRPLLEARAKKCENFCSSFGDWEDKIICFRNLLTFSSHICWNENRNKMKIETPQFYLHKIIALFLLDWTCPFNNMRITLIKVIITLFFFTEKVTCTSSDNGILLTPSRLLCCHFTIFSYQFLFGGFCEPILSWC